eukprot:9223243-Alexandrium_andersonii.AAC.1
MSWANVSDGSAGAAAAALAFAATMAALCACVAAACPRTTSIIARCPSMSWANVSGATPCEATG